MLELQRGAGETAFIGAGLPEDLLALLPHQRGQRSMSVSARGMGLALAPRRGMSTALGILVRDALGGLTGDGVRPAR